MRRIRAWPKRRNALKSRRRLVAVISRRPRRSYRRSLFTILIRHRCPKARSPLMRSQKRSRTASGPARSMICLMIHRIAMHLKSKVQFKRLFSVSYNIHSYYIPIFHLIIITLLYNLIFETVINTVNYLLDVQHYCETDHVMAQRMVLRT